MREQVNENSVSFGFVNEDTLRVVFAHFELARLVEFVEFRLGRQCFVQILQKLSLKVDYF